MVLCFAAVALLPNTVPMARSTGAPPFGFAASALRLLGAGALPAAAPGAMPRPTGPESGSGFRDLAPWAFLPVSCALSPSASAAAAAWFLEFFLAAMACFLSLLRVAASSARAWAAAESVAAASRRVRSACLSLALACLFSTYAQWVALPHLASSLNSASRCGQTSSMRASSLFRASLAVAMTWFFSSSEPSSSWILSAVSRKRVRRGMLVGSKTLAAEPSEGGPRGLAAVAGPAVLLRALIGAEAAADTALLGAPSSGRARSRAGVLRVSWRRSRRAASGAKILASTSLRRVKWRTSSLGRAVMASAKWVTPGRILMGCSGAGTAASGLARLRDEVRGGLTRVWRTGCLRLDPLAPSGAGGFAVFMAGGGEGGDVGR